LNKPVVVSEERWWRRCWCRIDDRFAPSAAAGPAYVVLAGISLSHFLNDTMQSLISVGLSILKESYALDFAQIGLTRWHSVHRLAAQPWSDISPTARRSRFSLSIAWDLPSWDCCCSASRSNLPRHPGRGGAGRVGLAVFHPESARIARLASGGSTVSRNRCFRSWQLGSSMGPVLAALIVVAIQSTEHRLVLSDRISRHCHPVADRALVPAADRGEKVRGIESTPGRAGFSARQAALAVLVALLFSKQLYVSSLSSLLYLLPDRQVRGLDPGSQFLSLHLSCRQRGGAFFGGPLGDRFGRKYIIWFSISARCRSRWRLPYAGLFAARC